MVWNVHSRLPRADVEAADVALGVFLRARRRAADHGGAEDDHVPHDDGRRCRADDAVAGRRLIEILIQIDDAVLAERRIGQAGLGVERHELIAARHQDDARLFAVGPVFDAADDAARRPIAARPFVEPVAPQRFPGGGVDGDDVGTESRGRVEHAADHQRRGLHVVLRPRAEVLRFPPPRDPQVLHVVAVDLIERRVLAAAEVGAPVRPLAVGDAGLAGDEGRRAQSTRRATGSDQDEQSESRGH